jgi:leucyl aminopeptidase
MLNTGTAEGGAITAALFLREFVTRPWVHLDIAGSAYLSKADVFSTKGATGVMHATLVELALDGAAGPAPGQGTTDAE